MTLDTRVRIVTPVPPRDVFAFCRSLIGATDAHDWTLDEGGGVRGESSLMMSPGQGLCAWLMVDWHADGPVPRPSDHDPELYVDREDPAPVACVEVSFDTAYGFRDSQGRSCSELHRDLTRALGDWLEERRADWWALDEFTGVWHHRTPCPVVR